MITLAIMLTWLMRQIDFVQAHTQAPIEHDMYMELPQRIETKHENSKDYVLNKLGVYGINTWLKNYLNLGSCSQLLMNASFTEMTSFS